MKTISNVLENFMMKSFVWHPMGLGGLMILLGFFLKLSLITIAIWIIYAVLCDWMTSYEENDLVKVLGQRYVSYQHSVSKWLIFGRRAGQP